MKVSPFLAIIPSLIFLTQPACNMHKEGELQEEHHKIVATNPKVKDITFTQPYVCQIHSKTHIPIKALQSGYLEEIDVKEGQVVKADTVMFKVVPTLYKARRDAELAEVQFVRLEYKNTKALADDPAKVVSQNEVLLYEARMKKAEAKLALSEAELYFTEVRAPFDGIIDRLHEQQGSLIKEGEVLTTLSDNSVMWVYFNVPEARYLEDMAGLGQEDCREIELVLADGKRFPQVCTSLRKEAQFNNETGNIKYRADFPNPDRLLRHGQTGKLFVHRKLKNATIIPQRATFEILDKRYVWVIDKDDVVHQHEIVVQQEMDDVFVVKKGCDLRLKSIQKDAHTNNAIPTEGKNLIVVANVDGLLHFRIFNQSGKVVVNADETKYPAKTQEIAALKKQLTNLWPPAKLTESETEQVIALASSIVGHTPNKGLDVDDRIVLEGVQQVHDGQKVEEIESRSSEEVLADLKKAAE